MRKSGIRKPAMDWGEWYLLALRYYDEHGDLLVPKDYVCPTGEKLGRWIERQRGKYNHVPSVPGHIDGWQIEYLERIDMVWKLETRRSLDEWLRLLDAYVAEHGNADVPHGYACDSCGLGDWLAKERLRYAAGELDDHEIAALEKRGVRWSAGPKPRAWDDWYADAARYYREHGNLMVKPDYVTPEGNRLGNWIYRQRDLYMGRKKDRRLTPEQIDRLNGIGMVWEPLASRPDDWERMYRWVAAYREENRKLPLWPRDLKSPDGRSMSGWIRTQRQSLSEGRLSTEQADRLASLGIVPAKSTPVRNGELPSP